MFSGSSSASSRPCRRSVVSSRIALAVPRCAVLVACLPLASLGVELGASRTGTLMRNEAHQMHEQQVATPTKVPIPGLTKVRTMKRDELEDILHDMPVQGLEHAVQAGETTNSSPIVATRERGSAVPDSGDFGNKAPAGQPTLPPDAEPTQAPPVRQQQQQREEKKWQQVDISSTETVLEPYDPEQRSVMTGPEGSMGMHLFRLTDGVGSFTYGHDVTSSRLMNYDFRRTLEAQDIGALLLLLLAFILTLFVSALTIYRVAEDPSPVLFYCDPKYTASYVLQRMTCNSADVDNFLRTFNTQPQNAHLRIIGKNADHQDWKELLCQCRIRDFFVQLQQRLGSSMIRRPRRRDGRLHPWEPIIFDVSLDISPFLTGDGELVSEADHIKLEKHFVAPNPLEIVILSKTVEWADWEDVATNIKQRLRSMGFNGLTEVRLEAKEEIQIYRNLPWQNFVRSRLTQVLVMLSLIGWVFWMPYLWCRMRTVRVESKFKINLDMSRYWEQLQEGLHSSEGFHVRTPMR